MSSSDKYKVLENMSPEEQKAWWAAERKKELEEDFEEFMKSPFEALRSKYYERHYDRDEATFIQSLLEEKLGTTDPEGELPEEAWRKSNWCSE